MKNEINLMFLSDHQNIIKIKEIFYFNDAFWMVQEIMSKNLTFLLYKMKFEEKLIAYVLKECLNALVYLHSNHRIHRDLKSDNVMVDR